MIIVLLAFVGATIVVALLVGIAYLAAGKNRPEPRALWWWAARLWVFNFILDLAILYFAMPAMTGPYWGGQWLLWPLLLTGVFALFGGGFQQIRRSIDALTERINTEGSLGGGPRNWRRGRVVEDQPIMAAAPRTGALAGVGAILLALAIATLVNGLIVVATTWFDGNAKALAAIPAVTPAPAGTTLPPTDANHIILVTQGVAAYLGQQVLASGGKNLGSVYHTERASYTVQSVNHHLYWVAPLVYNNVWANLSNFESPGYVEVDAEDPNSAATLHTGYHIRYLPGAIFNQDLLRHVYLSGYTGSNLADPTLEINDDGTPYFTISLMEPTRGFTGDVVKRVLIVDPQSGAIQNVAVKDVPTWVDRVLPDFVVSDYLTWWGKYHDAPWINFSGANQQVPAGQIELVYNNVDKPVWLVTMTSSAASDKSATGVILFDTRDAAGRFYPLNGIGISDNVVQTMTDNPGNIQKYGVGSLQLYQIYGEPTWVATFVRDNETGQNFEAVGIVSARQLTGANVIMAQNKSEALAQYGQWLATHNQTGAGVTPTGKQVAVQGKVARISAATERGTTVYYVLLEGQQRIFKADLGLSAKLPLVREGDQIRATYLDTGLDVVTLTTFDDTNIQTNAPAASPSPAP